jgi:hypothetical protein
MIGRNFHSLVLSDNPNGCGVDWMDSLVPKSDIAYLLRKLKMIRRSDSSILAIGVETEYRSVARSLFGWGPRGEPNAPIATESKVTYFLRWRRYCSCSSGLV